MAGARDYYEVLDVPRDADRAAIKDAFRRLALKYHPDRSKEPGAEERFKEIAEAYAVLSDPAKRAAYDARGHAGVAGLSPEDLFGGIDFEDLFAGFGIGPGGLFERLFRGRAGPWRGADVEIRLPVTLERIAAGGEEEVRFTRPAPCPACRGSGAKAGTAPEPCARCHGSGQEVKRQRKGGISFQQVTTCPVCGGRGSVIKEACRDCAGSGRTEREEAITLRIPVGVEDGTALRVPGRGLPSPEAGGPPGDLLVVVATAPDPRFERHGAHLWRTESVPVADAVLGTTLSVPTLDGAVEVSVPPGTQPGAVLRVRGKGLPGFGGGRRGDLYLRVQVDVPARPSAAERALYEQLRELAARPAARRR